MARRLTAEELYRECDVAGFPFRTTGEIPSLDRIIGQPRALSAIEFGLNLQCAGFNIYVLGESGTGKSSAIRTFIGEKAAGEPVPPDWCYVNNFRDPGEPLAVSLEPGQGQVFRKEMEELVSALQEEIPKLFDSKEYKRERDRIVEALNEARKELFTQLEKEAEGKGFNIRAAMGEFSLVAVGKGGEPITEEEFRSLDEETRLRIRENGKIVRERLEDVLRTLKREEKATRERIAEMERTAALSVLKYLVEEVRGKFPGNAKLSAYLDAVQEDVLRTLSDFKSAGEEGETPPVPFLKIPKQEPSFARYTVNVLVDNGERQGSPCVFVNNPTYYNLFGRIEHRFQMGVALTDFTMIRAGALHKANGGYLVVNALDLLRNIFSYDALKRAIKNSEARIEDVWEQYRLMTTSTMKPEPIPLHAKVILIGSPEIYYLLFNLDEEYRELFKVKADFENRMDRTRENVDRYAAFVATKGKEEKLRPFDRSAVGKVVEIGSRIADHQGKITTRFSDIANLLREADYWAGKEGAPGVTGEHVEKAWDMRVYRHAAIEDRLKEVVEEGTLLVRTEGAAVGQVNGLSVIDLGDYSFGKPSRISAAVHAGKGGILNLERETKLSGKIHDKAVLILTNYLGRTFGERRPMNLSASIAFEQLYGIVEGDSATCAEVYALLGAVSGLPLRQEIAVTGSMDQYGEVQPVGGVNEKVEGFFDLCRARGLTGTQGVILPSRNLLHLMLKKEVREAVREGRFHLWAIDRVEEGVEVLSGIPAGERDAEGRFPEGSFFRAVDDRLEELREAVRGEEAPPPADAEEEEPAGPGEGSDDGDDA